MTPEPMVVDDVERYVGDVTDTRCRALYCECRAAARTTNTSVQHTSRYERLVAPLLPYWSRNCYRASSRSSGISAPEAGLRNHAASLSSLFAHLHARSGR